MFGVMKSNIRSGVVVHGISKGDNLCSISKKISFRGSLLNYLYSLKWANGFCCPRCGYGACFVIQTRKQPLYECKSCKHHTTLTAGTIFEKTRTCLSTWFAAIFLVSHDKRGVSATLVANELEISCQTAWTMLQKIRKAMTDRDAPYILSGLVELDDFYIGAPTENGKRGRGTDKNQVLVALSKNKKGHPLYVKMKVIANMKKETVGDFSMQHIEKNSHVITDAHGTFPTLETKGYTVEAKKFDAKRMPEHLKWIHTIISNLKSFVSGTFHGLDARHLQRYLDEFCYRFNRRKYTGELFNRLLQACLSTKTITYPELRCEVAFFIFFFQ